jgi:hypothetical protein
MDTDGSHAERSDHSRHDRQRVRQDRKVALQLTFAADAGRRVCAISGGDCLLMEWVPMNTTSQREGEEDNARAPMPFTAPIFHLAEPFASKEAVKVRGADRPQHDTM